MRRRNMLRKEQCNQTQNVVGQSVEIEENSWRQGRGRCCANKDTAANGAVEQSRGRGQGRGACRNKQSENR